MKPLSKKNNDAPRLTRISVPTPMGAKESYRWVEAMTTVVKQVAPTTRVIHVCGREGDISEVFDNGIVVRAAHECSLKEDPHRL
jgi:hypothetical protein